MAHSRRQFDRVNVDPRRGAVSFGNQNNIQAVLCFTVIKIDRSQFFFFLNILLSIDLRVPEKAADRMASSTTPFEDV